MNLKVENSLGAVVKNKDSLDDLLRTHPFSADRQIEFEKWVSKETISVVSKSNEKFLRNKQLSELEIIASSIYHKRIDRAIYYAIHFHKRDSTNEIVNKIIPFCFAYLGYQKQNRRAGKHINSQSPNYDDKYNEYLNFLLFLKHDQCYDLASNWNSIYNSGKHTNNAIATDAIIHLAKKDYENFILRYEKEFEESNNYFIMPILEFLKTEKHP